MSSNSEFKFIQTHIKPKHSDNYLSTLNRENYILNSLNLFSSAEKLDQSKEQRDIFLSSSIEQKKTRHSFRNNKSFRLTLKDKLCHIIDQFFFGFFIYHRKFIKKSLAVFRNIINKKFQEKIHLFTTIHDQMKSIEMMIHEEMSKILSNILLSLLYICIVFIFILNR